MSVSRTQAATIGVLGLRVGYGIGLIVAPATLGRRWLGPAAQTAGTQVPLQGLGAREIVLHAGALLSAVRGASLRPWLLASIAGDLTDVVATLARRDQLPEGSAVATLLVGGGSALLSAALAAGLEH